MTNPGIIGRCVPYIISTSSAKLIAIGIGIGIAIGVDIEADCDCDPDTDPDNPDKYNGHPLKIPAKQKPAEIRNTLPRCI